MNRQAGSSPWICLESKKLLRPDHGLDLHALFTQFCESEGAEGLDHFLLYLHAQGHIESGTLTWVADAEAEIADST